MPPHLPDKLVLHLQGLRLEGADDVDVGPHLPPDDAHAERVQDDEDEGEHDGEEGGEEELGEVVHGVHAGVGHAGDVEEVEVEHVELVQQAEEFGGPGHGVGDVERGEDLEEGDGDLGLAPQVGQARHVRDPGGQVAGELRGVSVAEGMGMSVRWVDGMQGASELSSNRPTNQPTNQSTN